MKAHIHNFPSLTEKKKAKEKDKKGRENKSGNLFFFYHLEESQFWLLDKRTAKYSDLGLRTSIKEVTTSNI